MIVNRPVIELKFFHSSLFYINVSIIGVSHLPIFRNGLHLQGENHSKETAGFVGDIADLYVATLVDTKCELRAFSFRKTSRART